MRDGREARDRVARRMLNEAERRRADGSPMGRVDGIRSFSDAQREAAKVSERSDAVERETPITPTSRPPAGRESR